MTGTTVDPSSGSGPRQLRARFGSSPARPLRLLLGAACALCAAAELGCERDLSLPEAGDRTPPSLSQFSVAPRFAKAGSTVVLSLQSTKPLASATSTFGGAPAPCTVAGQGVTCTASIPQAGGGGAVTAAVEGDLSFSVTVVDRSGLVSTASAAAVVTLDFTPPLLVASVSPSPAVLGGPVTFVVDASEPLGAAPALVADFLAGVPVCSGAGSRYSCTGATIATSTAVGTHAFAATGIDRAGNGATSSPARLDVQSPLTLSQLVSAPEVATEGVLVTLTFQASRLLSRATSTFAGARAPCTVTGLSARCEATVPSPAEAGLGDGVQTFSITAVDTLGIAVTLSGVGSVLLDFTPPLLSVTGNPSPALLGGAVTFVVDASEPLGAPPSIGANFLAGVPVCSGAVPGTRFSCTGARVATSTSVGPHTFVATGADRAGNGASSNPVLLDVQSPLSLSGFAVEPASRVAKAGDRVRVSLQANRTLSRATSTLGNLTLACSVLGSTATCETTVPPRAPPGLDDGDRTLDVTMVDFEGIVAVAVAAATVRLDYTAPLLVVAETPSPGYRGAPTAFVVDADEPLAAPPVIVAPYLNRTPVCVGGIPGARFVCAGASIASSTAAGPHTFWATGRDVAGNLAQSSSTSFQVDDPPLPPPQITVSSVAPNPQRAGTSVSFLVTSDQPLSGCAASVSSLYAACDPPQGSSCACRFDVPDPPSLAEGEAIVLGFGTSKFGTGVGSAGLQLDFSPPVFWLPGPGATSSPVIGAIRKPVGVPDHAYGLPGAVFDRGVSYPTRRVQLVRLWASATSGVPLATAPWSPDGSIGEVSVTGTEGSSEQTISPKTFWFSAIDAVGNESGRVQGAIGADDFPRADGSKAFFSRLPLGQLDSVSGTAGALIPSACAIRAVALYYYDVKSHFAVGPANGDGSFPSLEIGTATSSWASAYIAGIDKCNPMPARYAELRNLSMITNDNDEAPTADPTLITIHRRDLSARDSVEGLAGAFRPSLCPLRDVTLFNGLGSGPALANGAFDEIFFGTTTSSVATLKVTVTDKCELSADAVPNTGVDDGARLSGTGLTLTLASLGGDATVRGAPGSVSSTVSAVRAMQLFDGEGNSLGDPFLTVTSGGGFPAKSIGPRVPENVYLVVEDKAGVSQRAKVRNVEGSIDLGGHVPHSRAGNPAAMYAFQTPLSPRLDPLAEAGFGPGLGALLGPEVNQATLAQVVAPGDGSASMSATTLAAGPPEWTWSRLPFPNGRGAAALARVPGGPSGQLVLFGGENGADGLTWRFSGGSWNSLPSGSSSPAAQAHSAMGWDGQRLVLFGGDRLSNGQLYLLDETWGFDGGTWAKLAPSSSPSERSGASLVEIPGGLLLFGGENTGPFGDLWRWDAAARNWFPVAATGTGPEPRSQAGAAYDSARNRVLLFGGTGRSDYLSDTWELDLGLLAWRHLLPADSPTGTGEAHLAWDPVRDRAVLVQGGEQLVWEFDGSTWRSIAATKVDRADVSLVWNPEAGASGQVTLFGGRDKLSFGFSYPWQFPALGDLLGWDGSSWQPLAEAPPVLAGASMAYDAANDSVLLHGGTSDRYLGSATDGTWSFDGSKWHRVRSTSTPSPLTEVSMVWEPTSGRTVVFGGRDGSGYLYEELALFDGRDWTLWAQEYYSTPWPTGRAGAAMAADPARGRIVLFGGFGNVSRDSQDVSALGDTWELVGTQWTQLGELPASPPARSGATLVYDPIRSEVVLFGGQDRFEQPLTDAWSFDGARWVQVSPGPSPAGATSTGAYSVAAGGVLLPAAGTQNGSGKDALLDQTGWSDLSPEVGPLPKQRIESASVWDPVRERLLLFGGASVPSAATVYSELWSLSRGGPSVDAPQTAVQLFSFPIDPAAQPSLLHVQWTGAGSSGGVVGVWNWATQTWDPLLDLPADGTPVTTGLDPLPGPLANYALGGKVWVGAFSTSTAAGSPLDLSTDYVRLDLAYTLPP